MVLDRAAAANAIGNAEDLRLVLREAELAVADLRHASPAEALRLVSLMEAIEEAVPRLETELGVDLKPERTRMQTLENMLQSQAGLLVRRAGAGRLAQAREARDPVPDEGRWWWYIDELVAGRRRQWLRRTATMAMGVAAALLVLIVAYEAFLAPTPEQRALAERTSQGETFLFRGDFEEALEQYEAALALNPEDADVHLHLGVVYGFVGRADDSALHLREAERLSRSPADYHAGLSLVYYRIAAAGAVEEAVALAEAEAIAALEADEESAMAHFAIASVYELQGRSIEAIQEFEIASQLSGDASLTVLARMRMGMLMQRPSQPMQTVTPEAEAPAS